MPDEKSEKTILVVDDDAGVSTLLESFLGELGLSARVEISAEAGLEYLMNNPADLIISDLKLPGMDGLEFVRTLKQSKFPGEILVISGFGTVQDAVEAIKIGAFDFIEKPLNLDRLEIAVKNALEKKRMEGKIAFLVRTLKSGYEFGGIIGNSEVFQKTKKMAAQIAGTDVNILISGESGTGKELFARAIHNAGERNSGPFVAINCGAIPENLLESEMFGCEKGAFTGAVSRRTGHFENADGGTIFLDEVTELPLPLQVKLLRVVQEKEFMRLGSSRPIRVNCRIISATNKKIEEEVAKGTFREDLFYRLNIFDLKLPLLRERVEDIPLLADCFLKKHSSRELRLDNEVFKVLADYEWPGNVRELENAIQRAAAVADGHVIAVHHLPEKILRESGKKNRVNIPRGNKFKLAKEQMIDSFEREFIIKALRENDGNVSRSAQQMDLPRQTLHVLMKKHGITGKELLK